MPPKTRKSPAKRTGAKTCATKKQKVVQSKKNLYYVYTLSNGRHEYIDNFQEAMEFENDYEPVIENKTVLKNKPSFEAHKASTTKKEKAQQTSTPTKTNKPHKKDADHQLSHEEKTKIDKINSMIQQNVPSNRIEIEWRTNSRAQECIVIIRFLNMYGQDQYSLKPNQWTVAIISYISLFKQESPVIQQAIENLSYGRKRDIKGDPHKVAAVAWNSPDKKIRRTYEQHVAHTHFQIPHATMQTQLEETIYLHDMCEEFGKTLQRIMQCPTFSPCLQTSVGSENLWKAMIGEGEKKGGLNVFEYIADCKIKVSPCSNLNSHLVLEDAQDLTTLLFNSRLPTKKYALSPSGNEDLSDDADGPHDASPLADDPPSDDDTSPGETDNRNIQKAQEALPEHDGDASAPDQSDTPADYNSANEN